MFSISGLYKRTSVILMAALLMAAIAFLYFANRSPAIPQRMLRIGFEQNPPLQFHTPDGLAGLGVETVVEAAKRAGVRMQWGGFFRNFGRGWLGALISPTDGVSIT